MMGEWLKGKFAVLSPDGETLHKQIIKKAEEQIKKNLQAIVLDGQRAPMEQYKTTEFDPAIQDLQKRLTKLQTALNNRVPADSPSIKRVSLALTELLRLVNARNDRFKKDIAGVQTAQAGLDKQFGKFGFRLDAVEDRMGAIEAGTADAAAVNQLIEATTRAFARVGVELFPTAPNDFAGPPSIAEADRLQLETLRTENTQLTRKVHELSKELELMKTQSDAYKMMLEYSLSDNDRLMNTVYPQDLNRGAGGAVSADPPQPQVGKNEMEGKREGDEAEKDGEDDRKKGDGAS